MTQEQLAHALGTTVKNLQRLERGEQNLTLQTLGAIAAALGVDAQALIAPPGSGLPWLRDGGRTAQLRALSGVGWPSTPADEPRPRGAIPFYTLRIAASPPLPNEDPEPIAWLLPPKDGPRTGPQWFVAQVVGTSMDPEVPHGALCLFRPLRGNDFEGRIVLVQHREIRDLDTGGSYAVKRVTRVTAKKDGATEVVLSSVNRRYKPAVIVSRSGAELRPIAELDRVLYPRR